MLNKLNESVKFEEKNQISQMPLNEKNQKIV